MSLDFQLDPGEFPELPQKTVVWAPVYLEPVMASGERITIGVAFQNGGGVDFHRTLEKRQLRTLFGSAADNLLGLINMIQTGIVGCESLREASLPINGAYVGALHEVHANSIADVLDTSMAMSSAFVALPEHGADDEEEEEKDVRTQVMDGVVAIRPGLKDCFDRKVKLKSDRPLRFAFAGSHAAINLGTLNLNNNFSTYVDKAKARILDLSNLRLYDRQHGIESLGGTGRQFYDMIVFHPQEDSPMHSRRDKDNMRGALAQLEEEGALQDVVVKPMTTSTEAIDWIVRREAA